MTGGCNNSHVPFWQRITSLPHPAAGDSQVVKYQKPEGDALVVGERQGWRCHRPRKRNRVGQEEEASGGYGRQRLPSCWK